MMSVLELVLVWHFVITVDLRYCALSLDTCAFLVAN